MRLVNTANFPIKCPDLGIDSVAPGECVDLDEGHCTPGRTSGGKRIPSTVEDLCPGLVPADEVARAHWLKPPAAPSAIRKGPLARTVADFIREGRPPGVAALLAEREAARFREVPSINAILQAGYSPAVARSIQAREVERARDHSRPYTEAEGVADDAGKFQAVDASVEPVGNAADRTAETSTPNENEASKPSRAPSRAKGDGKGKGR